MASKRRKIRDQTSVAPAEARSWAVPAWSKWCIAAWMLMLARTPFALVERIRLLPLPDESLLAQGRAWNPPLAYVAADWHITEISYWSGALLVAVMLATAVRWQAARENAFLLSAGVIGLVLHSQPFPLVDLLCLLLVAYLIDRVRRLRSGIPPITSQDSAGLDVKPVGHRLRGAELRCYLMAVTIFILAVIVSLEFGLIAILIGLLFIAPQVRRLRASHGLGAAIVSPAVWCGIVALPGLVFDGYFAALLRPLSWSWLDAPPRLLPSLAPIWDSSDLHWSYVLLAAPVVARWQQAVTGKLPLSDCLNLGVLTWMGVGCTHYAWFAAAAVLLIGRSEPYDRTQAVPARYAQAAWATLGIALLAVAVRIAVSGTTILASDMIQRVMDPTQWKLTGAVVLANLDQSAHWQHPHRRRQYQLVLTDRWDVHHASYVDYLATLDDWTHWRREAYLRDTGEWGGYQSRFREWNPTLVVADSSALSALHRVSVDSKWKVIGIDHRQVAFASSDAARSKPVIQSAGAALTTLELPRPGGETDFQRVVALGTPADARRVSAVLTALRLPYAALRVLPQDGQRSTRTAAVFAWCELAHRSHRYTGQYSLLDCCRGLSEGQLDGAAALVAQTHRYRETLAAAVRADASAGAEASAASDVESNVRQHLLLGQTALAIEHGEQLEDAAIRTFYTVLAGSLSQGPAECMGRLREVSDDLTGPLNAECSFYIGCLAVESGDFLMAREAFTHVSQSPSASPFAILADFYLSQL